MTAEHRPPSRDHIRPRSKGGTLVPGNRAIVCTPCNIEKGSRSIWSFLARLTAAGDRRAVIVAQFIGDARRNLVAE